MVDEGDLGWDGLYIIDPERPIVDAHHHIFNRPGREYMADRYRADIASGHRVIASVYMEAGAFLRPDGPEMLRPIGELEFANGIGAMGTAGYFGGARACAAIVGHADLRFGDCIASFLDKAQAIAPDRFRGIRQLAIAHPSKAAMGIVTSPPPDDLLMRDDFRAGLRHLAPRGLSFDVAVFHVQFAQVADLADAFPDTQFVLNHMGMIFGRGVDNQERVRLRMEWFAGLKELARRSNIACKLGGLGMPVWGFGFEDRAVKPDYIELAEAWGPYIQSAIEAFGPHRCLLESNFPIDGVSCDYSTFWNAMKRITASCSDDEKTELFSGTASRLYRIALPAISKEKMQ
jgi:predicted TIM-barrel fold metal-dependent hydrolase